VQKKRGTFSKSGTFFIGFFLGILVSAFSAIGLARYVMLHPQQMMVKAMDMGMGQVVEKTAESVPKDYIGQRQNDIAKSAQDLADAFSQDKLTPAEMNLLAQKMLVAVADQQLTTAEIDELIRFANQLSR